VPGKLSALGEQRGGIGSGWAGLMGLAACGGVQWEDW